MPSLSVTVTVIIDDVDCVPSGALSIRTPFSISTKIDTSVSTTSLVGRLLTSVETSLMAARSDSPVVCIPKTVCCESRPRNDCTDPLLAALNSAMKNCESFVSSNDFAIDSMPVVLCCKSGWN